MLMVLCTLFIHINIIPIREKIEYHSEHHCVVQLYCQSKSILLLLLQKRAIRAVSTAGFRAHSEPLFKIHNVLKVDDIYQQRLLVFYYNVVITTS